MFIRSSRPSSTRLGMAKFRAKLVKWGNSVGISLPRPIRESLDLNPGDEVELVDKDDSIIIKKARKG